MKDGEQSPDTKHIKMDEADDNVSEDVGMTP